MLVSSCWDKSGTSWHHHTVVVTKLVTVTDFLWVLTIQTARNKLLRACCHELVNYLLRADDI